MDILEANGLVGVHDNRDKLLEKDLQLDLISKMFDQLIDLMEMMLAYQKLIGRLSIIR